MKNKTITKWILALSLTAALVMPMDVVYAAKNNSETAAESGEAVEETVNVRTAKEFMEMAEHCKIDSWSVGKKINLTADIDLSKEKFDGIAYFNGIFEGNGHMVSVGNLKPKGSDYGFFRYIGEMGTVSNVKISMSLTASGSAMYIGGVAGVNYGSIQNTVFTGNISGQSAVGGIAGVNKSGAQIVGCSAEGVILATDCTGGIAGKNEGFISGCSSKCSVNVEELETSLDLGGVDLGSLNFTRGIVNRNDMGGITGFSSGVITDCKNLGTVGFNHTGYNVGGIAGSQKGMILNSVNEGILYGRKDVGGIVGQAVPYIESEYLEDKVAETKEDIDRLSRTMRGISASVNQASAEAKNYVNSLNNQYAASMDRISGSLGALSDAVSYENPKAQEYVNQINLALGDIYHMQPENGELSQEQMDAIQGKLNEINGNLANLQGAYSGTGSSAEELVNSISAELNNENAQQNLQNIAQSVDQNIQSAANGISSAANQLGSITDQIGDDLAAITGEEEYVLDISSIETAEDIDGVVSGCTNRGSIYGDLNVGGIVGTMNIEYESDPEFDMDLTKSVNVTLRSTVNDVVIHSINYGDIHVKRNCAGGIAGLQEMGLIYDCQGYGQIVSESGSYLGGIAGQSASGIQKTYSLCGVSGDDYLGGICGSGYTVKDSISICSIESEGEYLGSIAGSLQEEGEVKDNLYVNTALYGVDDISYAGIAEPRSYEEIMALEDVPEGFQQVTVHFETEDGEKLGEKTVAYGGKLTEKEFPQVPEEEGHYVEWTDTEELKDIRSNLTVYAKQVPWTESIAGNAGKNLFLVKGTFHEDAELVMEETEKPSGLPEKAVAEYAYTWSIRGENEENLEQFEGRFLVPDPQKKATLWMRQGEIGMQWKAARMAVILWQKFRMEQHLPLYRKRFRMQGIFGQVQRRLLLCFFWQYVW